MSSSQVAELLDVSESFVRNLQLLPQPQPLPQSPQSPLLAQPQPLSPLPPRHLPLSPLPPQHPPRPPPQLQLLPQPQPLPQSPLLAQPRPAVA